MSVVKYWEERLENRCALFIEQNLLRGDIIIHNKVSDRKWPHKIGYSIFYTDYHQWLEYNKCLGQFEGSTLDIHVFYAVFAEIALPLGLTRHVSVATSSTHVYYQGSYFKEKTNKKFIALLPINKHIEYYEIVTGRRVPIQHPMGQHVITET